MDNETPVITRATETNYGARGRPNMHSIICKNNQILVGVFYAPGRGPQVVAPGNLPIATTYINLSVYHLLTNSLSIMKTTVERYSLMINFYLVRIWSTLLNGHKKSR